MKFIKQLEANSNLTPRYIHRNDSFFRFENDEKYDFSFAFH